MIKCTSTLKVVVLLINFLFFLLVSLIYLENGLNLLEICAMAFLLVFCILNFLVSQRQLSSIHSVILEGTKDFLFISPIIVKLMQFWID